MKVVILAGGYGTRISEESHLKPKPMIEIDGKPIMWHIMKYYSSFGFQDFIICCGYKGYVIKEFFADYFLHNSDITFDLRNNRLEVLNNDSEPWRVTCVDTGLNTMTGGRIKRIQKFIGQEPFLMTYGDGVSDVDINALIQHHKQANKTLTLTAVRPGGRFGALELSETNEIRSFKEKNIDDGGWINGGFMVIEPEIFEYLDGDSCVFEREPLETLASMGELQAYKHYGFWQCMDTMNDKNKLEKLLEKNEAPWKVWD
ncbi:glucose-1-phosphate cytidylyltransferase [Holdemania massiliensis]|uniref:glucose-1-phosphate cytidylyltransferase n=1 Tax=Holdemania massiliensis TaxID=1468449 RepID=UPI0035200292